MTSTSQPEPLPQDLEKKSLASFDGLKPASAIRRVGLYALSRILTIAVTIVIGVFFTIIVANKGGGFDESVADTLRRQANQQAWLLRNQMTFGDRQVLADEIFTELAAEAGLNDPFLPKHLRWTWNALRLELGDAIYTQVRSVYPRSVDRDDVQEIILSRFPNTLALVGLADLLVFVIGIPLSLYLSRNYGSWFDKLINLLSPLSSVPSWVHGILLILIFSVTFQLLPPGGMIELPRPDTQQGILLSRLEHMILPTLAIFLSLLFQLVYTWRNYFMIYSNEDYVELAVAQGLSPQKIQNKYILRPAMPFVLTSFALTLVSFWQMATALEVVFNWDGIGKLYIISLPNFWSEQMFPGEVGLTIGIVVIFAYLLGMIVLLLDVAYALVDPRIRLGGQEQRLKPTRARQRNIKVKPMTAILGILALVLLAGMSPAAPSAARDFFASLLPILLTLALAAVVIGGGVYLFFWLSSQPWKKGRKKKSESIELLPRKSGSKLVTVLKEMMRYRSAVAGLIILMVMVAGSIYAVIRYPYREVGVKWYTDNYKNSTYVPRTAYPGWVNVFRRNDFPETIIIDSQASPEVKSVKYTDSGHPDYTFTFEFDYPYGGFPTEATLYFDTKYQENEPFATFVWTTPDGRELDLKNAAISNDERYKLEENIDRRLVNDHAVEYKIDTSAYGIPLLNAFFQDPEIPEPEAMQGTYTLEVKVLGFDPDTEVDVEMVILGQIYGAAGTDFYRRDLTVPLLWGMPFALVIGLFGALLTTVVSMLFAAFGVWFGGWADNLVQRVTEANMILPVVAIAVLFYAFYGASLWTILTIIVILNAFGSPTKTFRAAFLQIKDASYIEAAQAYGAPNRRIILRYMIPRILPVLIPQLVTLIPGFIFLEATLGMFNVKSNLPTWGKVIYEALAHGAAWGSKFWVLEPIALLLLTGFAFSMMGFALDRVLNPRLQQGD